VAINSTGAANSVVAPEEIVSLYGDDLSAVTLAASTLPLPDSLSGYRVTVKDSAGTTRNALLYAIAPRQFNFVMPAGVASGIATLSVGAPGLRPPVTPIQVNVAAVAPGLFTLSGDGTGTPAALLVRVAPGGAQTIETLSADGARIGGDTLYLILYGTGIRNGSNVVCAAGGVDAPVAFAGRHPDSPGLDQVNVMLPAALAGKGDVTLTLTVDGSAANPVHIKLL
jgi:uncharacterized protein (TIGR03437 family)